MLGAHRTVNETELTQFLELIFNICIESPVSQATLHTSLISSLQRALEGVTFIPFHS